METELENFKNNLVSFNSLLESNFVTNFKCIYEQISPYNEFTFTLVDFDEVCKEFQNSVKTILKGFLSLDISDRSLIVQITRIKHASMYIHKSEIDSHTDLGQLFSNLYLVQFGLQAISKLLVGNFLFLWNNLFFIFILLF